MKLEYRMYGLVPYNLSPIQQGIQFGHAVVEYMLKFYDPKLSGTTPVVQWAEHDKTFIILNGGTTNMGFDSTTDDGFYKGSLNNHAMQLDRKGVELATFYEPDLGDQLTAVVFLVDERVWNYEKYPVATFEDFIKVPHERYFSGSYMDYKLEILGTSQNLFLRDFLKQFRLA